MSLHAAAVVPCTAKAGVAGSSDSTGARSEAEAMGREWPCVARIRYCVGSSSGTAAVGGDVWLGLGGIAEGGDEEAAATSAAGEAAASGAGASEMSS